MTFALSISSLSQSLFGAWNLAWQSVGRISFKIGSFSQFSLSFAAHHFDRLVQLVEFLLNNDSVAVRVGAGSIAHIWSDHVCLSSWRMLLNFFNLIFLNHLVFNYLDLAFNFSRKRSEIDSLSDRFMDYLEFWTTFFIFLNLIRRGCHSFANFNVNLLDWVVQNCIIVNLFGFFTRIVIEAEENIQGSFYVLVINFWQFCNCEFLFDPLNPIYKFWKPDRGYKDSL